MMKHLTVQVDGAQRSMERGPSDEWNVSITCGKNHLENVFTVKCRTKIDAVMESVDLIKNNPEKYGIVNSGELTISVKRKSL